MTSACVAFSKCRIQFIPNDQQRPERDYSDRSLVELRQYDFANFSLRALDIDHNKEEIFAIPLESEDQYICGQSATVPDEIHSTPGTYRLWLDASSRANFHQILNAAINETKLIRQDLPPPTTSTSTRRFDQDSSRPARQDDRDQRKSIARDDSDQRTASDRDNRDQRKSIARDDSDQRKASARDNRDQRKSNIQDDSDRRKTTDRDNHDSPKSARQSDQIDVVDDVYQLGECIKRGRTDDAVDLAKKLSKQRVRLEAKLHDNPRDEKPILIRVRIDTNGRTISNQQKEFKMNVYPSTTIAELRAAFQYSKDYSPSNQYFFVNGHLAHEKSTMKELDVEQDILFVLFVIGP